MAYVFIRLNNLFTREFGNLDLFLTVKSDKFYEKFTSGLKKCQEMQFFVLGYMYFQCTRTE